MNFSNLLRHISFKHIKLNKTQLALIMGGICLGVAAIVSIDIVNHSVLASFESAINHISGRAALMVSGPEAGFPEEFIEQIQSVTGVEYAVPVIETNANLAQGQGRSLVILGVDVLQDHQIRNYAISDESADIPDPLLFLARPDSILLTRSLADREQIKLDQEVKVQTVAGIHTFKVRGLLNPEGPAKVAGGDMAVMDLAAAQLAFGKEGRIDHIDLSLLPGEQLDTVKTRIQKVLPAGYEIDTPAGRTKQVELLLIHFRKAIRLTGFMAIFVGMYLIYNSVSISVVQRRKEIGILRALGVRRGEIIALFLGETLVISLCGSLLGVLLGLAMAKLTIHTISQIITEVYLKTTITDIAWSWPTLFQNAAMGILAGLAAAAFPAIASSRISPISAIRSLPYAENGSAQSSKTKIAATITLLLAILLLMLHKITGGRQIADATHFAVVLILLCISLHTPIFLKWFLDIFHLLLSKRLGAGGRLAGLNLQKNLARNAVVVASIFCSITLFVCSACLIHSFRQSVFAYIDSIIRADIFVSSGHPMTTGGSPSIPMPAEMLKEFEEIPGVLMAEPYRKVYTHFNGKRVLLAAFDVTARLSYCPAMLADGNREDLLRLLPDKEYIAVNEGLSAQHGLKPGDKVMLPTPSGPHAFGVAAVVVDYASDSGCLWMDIQTYRRIYQDHLVDMYELRLKPNTEIEPVCTTILERMGQKRRIFALPAGEFKEEVRKMLNRSFVVTNAVNIITLLIAALGIIVTLLASVLERTREIGVLRSIGMLRTQVAAIVIIESALIGAAAGLLGAAVGLLIGRLELEAFFQLNMGASISFHVHYAATALAILLAIILSALAGLYPAHRAAKTNIVEALAYE